MYQRLKVVEIENKVAYLRDDVERVREAMKTMVRIAEVKNVYIYRGGEQITFFEPKDAVIKRVAKIEVKASVFGYLELHLWLEGKK